MESIVIDPAAASEIEVLQEMIMIATNSAMRTVNDKMQKEISKVTGGMNIPGL